MAIETARSMDIYCGRNSANQHIEVKARALIILHQHNAAQEDS